MPAVLVRVVLGLLALVLCLAYLPEGAVQVIGIGLATAAVAKPRWLAPWGLVLLLAAVRLAEPFSGLDAGLLILIAAVHALHLLGALSLWLPVRGWLQLRALRRSASRYLLVQAAVQAFAIVVLLVLGPDGAAATTVPLAALIGAIALLGLVLLWAGRLFVMRRG